MRKMIQVAGRGYTLIEALVTMAIFAIVFLAVYMMFDSSTAIYAKSTRKQDVQQQARLALDDMTRQLRMTGFYPELFNAGVVPTQLAVHIATPTALAVWGDLQNNASSAVYLYCLNGNTLVAKSGLSLVDGGYNQAPPYSCTMASDQWVMADNVAGLNFVYYDATGTQIVGNGANGELDGQAPGAIPNYLVTPQRQQIRKVVITLTVQENAGPTRPRLTLTSTVRLRELN